MGTHDKDLYTKAIKAEENVTGKRWCSQCQFGKLAKGGQWILSLNGQQRRWMCKDCYERKLEREKK
jgi:hypothetical protein